MAQAGAFSLSTSGRRSKRFLLRIFCRHQFVFIVAGLRYRCAARDLSISLCCCLLSWLPGVYKVSSMSSSSSKSNAVALTAAAASAVVSIVVTYTTLTYLQSRREEKARAAAFEERQVAKRKQKVEQVAAGDPEGTLLDDVKLDRVYLWDVETLGARFPPEGGGKVVNRMQFGSKSVSENDLIAALKRNNIMQDDEEPDEETDYNKLIGNHDCIIADLVRKAGGANWTRAYLRAGPRKKLHFNPKTVNAAIVTCGGLCPGLNNVVREIAKSLKQLYGVEGKVWGIRGGYKGFYDKSLPPIELSKDFLDTIHHEGGTVLGSSRGGFDIEKIIGFLKEKKIKQLYVIGGDGTHRGAFKIHEECMERGMNVAVAGIPKTIDNDIDYIDKSFGFQTAVEASQMAIRSAKTEAVCNLPNGVGIVKLMGRSAGFIAVHATMASGDVDLCLVPEVPTVLDGKDGCLPHIFRRVHKQGHAVIVVAEGAGEDILGESTETDASGNKKLPKIGEFMKTKVEEYFKEKGETATVKYIDPSYMIRSIPANAADSLYCMQLAQNAVHGAMAGYTGFSVGLCANRMVFLPIPELVATSPRSMNPYGRTWERVLAVTRQPNTCPPADEADMSKYSSHAPMLR